MDIQLEVTPVTFEQLTRNESDVESSESVRTRVINTRKVQNTRYAGNSRIHTNSMLESSELTLHCKPDKEAYDLLKRAMKKLDLSARAYDRILKVARTIADMEEIEIINDNHIAEAIAYRNLDRRKWTEY